MYTALMRIGKVVAAASSLIRFDKIGRDLARKQNNRRKLYRRKFCRAQVAKAILLATWPHSKKYFGAGTMKQYFFAHTHTKKREKESKRGFSKATNKQTPRKNKEREI